MENLGRLKDLKTKLILNLGFSEKCLLLTTCNSMGIDCYGERIPWCALERMLEDKSISGEQLTSLYNDKLIKVLFGLENLQLPEKKIKDIDTNFKCPFLRFIPKPCPLTLCFYYSYKINIRCILAFEKIYTELIPLETLSVLKDIDRVSLLTAICEGTHLWNKVEKYLKGIQTIKSICPECGYYLLECEKDITKCRERQELVFPPMPITLDDYPKIGILLVLKKIFGTYLPYIISSKTLKLYGLN
jgi:hypothetical protein